MSAPPTPPGGPGAPIEGGPSCGPCTHGSPRTRVYPNQPRARRSERRVLALADHPRVEQDGKVLVGRSGTTGKPGRKHQSPARADGGGGQVVRVDELGDRVAGIG